MKSKTLKKMLLLALIAGLVTLFFVLGLQKYLTLEFIKDSRDRFQEMYTQRPFFIISSFLAVYIPAIALNLPGAAILGLGAGALFGALPGTLIISFASTIGATLACLLSRYLLRDWIQKKFSDRLERINNGIQEEGAFYLFSMRLIPVIPFFVINMAMGLTPMRLRTFYWVSQLGMLPGTFIYVNAGSQIARIDSLAGIVSPGLIGSLALLGLFPLVTKKLLNAFQNRSGKGKTPAAQGASTNCPEFSQSEFTRSEFTRSEFIRALEQMQTSCTDCGACKSQCAFLESYGTPKQLLESFDMTRDAGQAKAFECSLCNLCSAVCPEQLDPGRLFFLARKQAMATGRKDLSKYKGILSYEQKGSSPLFSWYGLPHGCDTIFFPGCTLPGTRPETTWKMFRHLQTLVPSLGIVLDCCTKISHDLGRQDHFDFMFSEMLAYLKKNHIKNVWVACPNCYKIFASHGKGLQVTTVYEIMDGHDLPKQAVGKGELVVHDPCPLRLNTAAQTAVRSLVDRMGMAETQMHHQGRQTLCCGEGGSVGCVRPDLAKTWGRVRQKEAKGSHMVTYCAGCAGFLNRVTPTLHLADLIFDTKKSLDGGPRVASAPFTYLHRIRLKHQFKKTILPVVQRVRNCDPKILARQRKDECTLEDCTASLGRKGLVLGGVFCLSIGLFFLARHLMYLLDAYVYTAEFHAMFIKNNLIAANAALFAEYFKALGPLGSIPNLVAGAVLEGVAGFWHRSILYAGMNQAFGPGVGSLISLAGFCTAGLIFYGLGRFFLGDILPLFRKTKAPLSGKIGPALAVMLVIPHIPVALPAILGAVTRIRLKTITLILVSALLVRVILLSFLT